MIDNFKKAGICFSFCREAVVPQVPYVADVLYALRLSGTEQSYSFCRWNHEPYVANVYIVAAAVGLEVMSMRPYDEPKAKQIIATAIVDLCPPAARCLFNSAYVEARKIAGQATLPENADRQYLIANCECRNCRSRHVEESSYLVGG